MTRTQIDKAFKGFVRSIKKAYSLKNHADMPKILKLIEGLNTAIDKAYADAQEKLNAPSTNEPSSRPLVAVTEPSAS